MKTYPTLPQPCVDCPFRCSNRDKPHPKNFYDPDRAVALWAGGRYRGELFPPILALKNGARQMTCHKTDPKAVPGAKLHACAGALVCQHREVIRANELGDRYRQNHPDGLELRGVVRIASVMFGRPISWTDFKAIPTSALVDAATPAIADLDIGHPKLRGPTFAERTFAWAGKRRRMKDDNSTDKDQRD